MKQAEDVLEVIHVDNSHRTPKYKQIVESVVNALRHGRWQVGQQLPSINAVSIEHLLARETVVKAYNELRARGLIEARHGKGYYVRRTDVTEYHVCLLFNKISAHKKTVYDAIVTTLGPRAHVDLYVYHNDFDTFQRLIDAHAAAYTHLVVISHFYGHHRAAEVLARLPPEKLIVLDRLPDGLPDTFAAVYQNFSRDIFRALEAALDALRGYDRLTLVYPDSSYHSMEISRGFQAFCDQYALTYRVLPHFAYQPGLKREAYLVLDETDLVALLHAARDHQLTLGDQLGVISYNESPLKEFIAGGLTVVSTDFAAMGETAARMVLAGGGRQGKKDDIPHRVENPFGLIWRRSL